MKCPKCYNEIEENAIYCSFCGEKVIEVLTSENSKRICSRCMSENVKVQAVLNKTRRRYIKTTVLLITFILPIVLSGYQNRLFSFAEGALVGAIFAVPITLVVSLILKIVFKFIPESYDTLFICGNCGYNWKSN